MASKKMMKCKEIALSVFSGLKLRELKLIANPAFSAKQKRILRQACKSPWITQKDLELIADHNYTGSQMWEMMRACEELPYEQAMKIADPRCWATEMHAFRIKHRKVKVGDYPEDYE